MKRAFLSLFFRHSDSTHDLFVFANTVVMVRVADLLSMC